MHKNNIVHRDMKTTNIVMDSTKTNNLDIKISDLGFARYFDPAEGMNFFLGSPFYIAPEMYMGKKYNEKLDVWSVGVIAYTLLTGVQPFFADAKADIKKAVLERDISTNAEY
jgi:serine/threonine protein kinase